MARSLPRYAQPAGTVLAHHATHAPNHAMRTASTARRNGTSRTRTPKAPDTEKVLAVALNLKIKSDGGTDIVSALKDLGKELGVAPSKLAGFLSEELQEQYEEATRPKRSSLGLSEQLWTSVSPEIAEQARGAAEHLGLSVSWLLRKSLRLYLESEEFALDMTKGIARGPWSR